MTALTRMSVVLALSISMASVPPLKAQEAALHDSTYVVAEYDPARDPTADLELAVTRARVEGKRILMIIGGNWCIDCLNLDWIIGKTPTLEAALRKGFLVLKVNVSQENWNRGFLAAFPATEWFPHILVLESDGTLLHSQDTRELDLGRSESEQVFQRFLERWTPTRDQGESGGLETAAYQGHETGMHGGIGSFERVEGARMTERFLRLVASGRMQLSPRVVRRQTVPADS